MSQIGSPDFLGPPQGLGTALANLAAVANGGAARVIGPAYVGRALSILLSFTPHPGNALYQVTWTFYGYDQVTVISTQTAHVWNNGKVSLVLPVAGPFVSFTVTPVGGSAADTYDLLIIPSFMPVERAKAPRTSDILFYRASVNIAGGVTLNTAIPTMAWGLAYLQYGMTATGVRILGRLLTAAIVEVGYAFDVQTPTNPQYDVIPVVLTPYALQVQIFNTTAAAINVYFTLAMVP